MTGITVEPWGIVIADCDKGCWGAMHAYPFLAQQGHLMQTAHSCQACLTLLPGQELLVKGLRALPVQHWAKTSSVRQLLMQEEALVTVRYAYSLCNPWRGVDTMWPRQVAPVNLCALSVC